MYKLNTPFLLLQYSFIPTILTFLSIAMHFIHLLAALLAAGPARAWWPGEDKEIYAADGSNLFNNTAIGTNSTSKRWLQASGKVRGVNLGSLFVFEPWIAQTEWSNMGCAGQASEFDCVSHLGQTQANSVFQAHWGSWITQSDISQMQSYGLNTIRIPVGYWMKEDLVYSDSEHFPQGGLAYLEQVCGWASDAGFYIIIDLHGAPGAQVPTNPDTGQVSHVHMFHDSRNTNNFFRMLPAQVSTWTTNMLEQKPSCPGSRI